MFKPLVDRIILPIVFFRAGPMNFSGVTRNNILRTISRSPIHNDILQNWTFLANYASNGLLKMSDAIKVWGDNCYFNISTPQ
jgi:hypothetical protein